MKTQNDILNGHTERIRGLPGPLFIGGIVEYFADLSGGLHPRKQISFRVDTRDHHLSSICFVCRRTQAIMGCANGCQRWHQNVIVHFLGMHLAKNGDGGSAMLDGRQGR